MKKIALIFTVAFVMALALSSCNNEVCPAYAEASTDSEHIS